MRRRITLFLSSLNAGGAERVAVTLANGWAERGHVVRIVTMVDTPSAFSLHPAVHVDFVQSRVPSGSWGKAIRAWATRKVLRWGSPDVVVAFGLRWNVLATWALAGTGIPVVVTEHIDPRLFPHGAAWNALRSITYPYADAATITIEAMRERFSRSLQGRFTVISNPVLAPPPELRPDLDVTRFVAMGRLDPQKGFDLLLEAFSKVAADLPAWSLTIYGEGPERETLEAQRKRLGLEERVFLPGLTREAYRALASGSVFILSSRYEGFGMVLCEALACGVPSIAFDCPVGPRDILRHGVDGLVVPNGDICALVDAMRLLALDGQRRYVYGQAAPQVLERFGVDAVLESWDTLFARVVAPSADCDKAVQMQ